MELYHGSTEIVTKPLYGFGKATNDYGRGFYCTEVAAMAMEWACKEDCDRAFVNKYDLDTSDLNILDLSSEEFNVLNWLAVLVKNREVFTNFSGAQNAIAYLESEFLPDYSKADVIVGYRADDSYFSIARAFLQNSIPVSLLNRALKLENLGKQVVLKSEKAFDNLLSLGYGPVDYNKYFERKRNRDNDARQSFSRMRMEPYSEEDIFMIDILRQNIKNSDARLF